MRKIYSVFLSIALVSGLSVACKKDNQSAHEAAKPIADNIEIGTGNNKNALRGRDFHLNADVLAGDKISDIQVKILQKSTESYSAPWKFELSWAEFKGVKNTTVHKHFTIPVDAPEGKYDFFFIVLDENGSKLEIKEDFVITDPTNVPVDPQIGRDMISRNGQLIYYMETWVEKELIFKKGDELKAHAQVNGIKGDGVLYSVLIKRSANYHPESVDNLDLNKVIVISKVEHHNLPAASKFATLRQINGVWGGEDITIGTTEDFNEPKPNLVSGEKSWASGQYDLVFLYKNTTYNRSTFKSFPITVDYK